MPRKSRAQYAAAAAAPGAAPLSGRYRGAQTKPVAGLLELELRVDIDAAVPNSRVMNRVSGDLYQLNGGAAGGSKTYLESWIVDSPSVSSTAAKTTVSGDVRFWNGAHPGTKLKLEIAAPRTDAQVTLSEPGGTVRVFVCPYVSEMFRDLIMEVDVCASVNREPLLPEYATNALSVRPANLPARTLDIALAYRETGVGVTVQRPATQINDSAPSFKSWTAAELFDAMQTNFSRFNDAWPNWALWGVMAGRYENPLVGGLMFDTRYLKIPTKAERRGFAVFRSHSWFDDLVQGAPANDAQATAARQFLYTWVHEAGHAFNLLHSWDKNRPQALSWMNYDSKYDQQDQDAFWRRFAFSFDDEELLHIRHGSRNSVIMGGDPWSSGSHLEAPPLAMAQIEGDAPLEVILRSKQRFELIEPVIVEIRLRNLLDTPLDIDTKMAPEFGALAVFIQKPSGEIVAYEPPICALATPQPRTLAPASQGEDGEDRYSREIFLTYGTPGFYFDRPGNYKLRAVYRGPGGMTVPSPVHRIRIAAPTSDEIERVAQDYFSDEVGMTLYLQGSRSPYLDAGTNVLGDIVERFGRSLIATNTAMALANGLSKPFHRLEGADLALAFEANPDAALHLTERPLEVFQQLPQKALNLAYGRIVRRRADYHLQAGSSERALAELKTLQEDLRARGAHRSAISLYGELAQTIAASAGRPQPA